MLEFKDSDNELTCCFSGRIDTKAAMELQDELIDKVQHAGKPVVFDFDGLEYIASSFLRVCVQAARVLPPNEKLTVINASDELLHILDMTGFGKLMDIRRS